jgi:3-deoxy-manno-octulosonate cytidylyltransferase (CMP-KDO synthetase)
MKIIAIIPARYGSTRLPGKPLKIIGGKSMIQRVYEQVSSFSKIQEVCVATDDNRIVEAVKSFGGNVKLTSIEHKTGTDRCIEVLESYPKNSFDAVINVQGDEPFIRKEQLESIVELLEKGQVQIATLKKQITEKEELFNPNAVKVVTDNKDKALYFSRNPIPFVRGEENWLSQCKFYKHLGIYGFKAEVLLSIKNLEPGVLENAESLEQLRWMENGFNIYLSTTSFQSPAVDTEEDLITVENFLKKHTEFL